MIFQFVALVWTVALVSPAFTWKADVLANSGVLSSLTADSLSHSSLCTLMPGNALALVHVEQDTALPHETTPTEPMSATGMRPGPDDSLLATPTTLMPAARVRLLQLDSATRVALASAGVTDDQPLVFIRAAPYRADCKTIRWTDTIPFVVRGEVGYVRAILAPPEQWINGVPLLVIPDVWNYPYPRRRGLAFRVPPDAALAPAEAMFSLSALLDLPRPLSVEVKFHQDSVRRTRALAWARANATSAELEPVRALVRRAVLEPDWQLVSRVPSRLRGSYRVDIDVEGKRGTWFFRTHDRPGYGWRGPDSVQTTTALLASPYAAGYRLVGLAAGSPDSLLTGVPRRPSEVPLVWLAMTDRPTMPGNDARLALLGFLEFNLAAAPEFLWDDLEPFVPRLSPMDSAMLARLNRPIPRSQKQPQLPLTVRLEARGAVRADTTLTVLGQAIRVRLERIDTLSIRRPF
jgi:hypothetical protein